jgi:hypothetical protein
MVVSTPTEQTNDKDGSYCVIYDVLVHPDVTLACSLDAAGDVRHKVFCLILVRMF